MKEIMSVTEALIYMVKRYKRMCEGTDTEKLTDTDQMSLTVALPYLDKVKELTRKNEVIWRDYSELDDGMERFTMSHDNFTAVFMFDAKNYGEEEFHLYVETEDGKWYLFGKEFENDIINIYNWMTIEYENDSNVVDAEYEVVEDNTPFEFVVNSNYNFETLGA